MELRPYQEKALAQLGIQGEQVLSICPGGGKTLCAIEFIKRNPQFKRVLILTHGTNVLKSQWSKELTRLNIQYSNDILDLNAKLVVAIPQGIRRRSIGRFDLVIVDEAHELYLVEEGSGKSVGMVKRIIKEANPTCKLLLTGTPSKFIKRGYTPVIISGVEVYSEGYLTDTYFGLVKSSYKLDTESYNIEGDTKDIEFSEQDTNSSLVALIDEMLTRLKTPEVIKDRPSLVSIIGRVGLNNFQQAFTSLGKTLIATKSTEQAAIIYKTLVDKGVPTVLSTYKLDKESEEVEKFLTDDSIQCLVVVRRGILGFNMPELVNVVDFTMSRNIDRIYQLYARSLRKHPTINKKFFFRLCSSINPSIDSFYLQAALCLNSKDFISKYNGKNLKGLEILVPKRVNKILDKVSKISAKGKKNKEHSIDNNLFTEVIGLQLMNELIVNPDTEYWKEFEYTKMGEVVEKLTGDKFIRPIKNITEENLLWMIKHGKVDERIYG